MAHSLLFASALLVAPALGLRVSAAGLRATAPLRRAAPLLCDDGPWPDANIRFYVLTPLGALKRPVVVIIRYRNSCGETNDVANSTCGML